ncbi:MAG TPA: CinA family protein [Candidatus Deferrimicrobiaceae bacterium]|jgi:PncC family amidohydrolase
MEGFGALAATLGTRLKASGLRLAVAESCTGGLLAAAVTAVPGSSDYFLGGVVAYHNDAKTALLGVPGPMIASDGAVSASVAVAMAEGALLCFGADVAVGVTGIAGPGGGMPDKPVGTVWVAVSAPGVCIPHRLALPGDREQVRAAAVRESLRLLIAALGAGP